MADEQKIPGKIVSAIGNNLPVIGGVVQGVSDAIQSRRNTDRTIKAQRDLAEYQFSKDLEMWNRGNVYNSPSAQMERIKSAGLNPNLVYGTGVAGNSSGQLPKYQAPQVSYQGNTNPVGSVPQTLAMHQQFEMQKAQINNVNAQTAATRQKAENDAVMNRILAIKESQGNITTDQLRFNLDKSRQMLPFQIQSMQGLNEKVNREIKKIIGDTGLQDVQRRNMESQMKYRVGALDKMEFDKQNVYYNTLLKDAQLQYQQYLNNLAGKGLTPGAIWNQNPINMAIQNWDEIKERISGLTWPQFKRPKK